MLKLYKIFFKNERYEKVLSIIILIYALSIMILSLPRFDDSYVKKAVLISFGILFTLEYLLKLLATQINKKNFQWTLSFFGLIDLVAILSFCLSFFFHYNFLFLRILRILKVLPINRDNHVSKSLDIILKVIEEKRHDLLASFILLSVLLVIASCAIYCFENGAQPEKFSSIPHSTWWAIITMTTVGYGDIYPITFGGKIIASLFAVIGFGFVALPAGIISTGYIKMRSSHACEKCGHLNKG